MEQEVVIGHSERMGESTDTGFFVGRDRAMVSLGPLRSRHCAYRCAFCYVKAQFPTYPSFEDGQILDWLKLRRDRFSIVYISGDTDSFAPPRGRAGLHLVEELLTLDVDVLFTTRARIAEADRDRWSEVAAEFARRAKLLIGCISISQLERPQLEPPPIPSVSDRTETMAWLQSIGVRTALTIRPFLPMLPASEYAAIVRRGASASDVIIGGDWYVDVEGRILRDTAHALGMKPTAIELPDAVGPLHFSNDGDAGWLTYSHPRAEAAVRQEATSLNLPFFMGSEAAVAHLRAMRSRTSS